MNNFLIWFDNGETVETKSSFSMEEISLLLIGDIQKTPAGVLAEIIEIEPCD